MKVSGQKSFVQKNDHLNQTLSVDRPSPPPPCSPTSPTYAIRELEKEEVWTYLTNGAMSQFVSALVAGSITAPSLVITATSYWNIKHKQTLNLNWADICHGVVPDIHTTHIHIHIPPPLRGTLLSFILKKTCIKRTGIERRICIETTSIQSDWLSQCLKDQFLAQAAFIKIKFYKVVARHKTLVARGKDTLCNILKMAAAPLSRY